MKKYLNAIKLDIITVSFNSVNTIGKTLDSIKSQKKYVNSFIVVDGGSSDGTAEIISKYMDIVDVFICEPDNGISDAFNKGILASKGDFILLLNSDDWLFEGSVAKLIDMIEFNDDLLCTNMLSIDGNNGNVNICISKPSRLKIYNSVLHPGLIVRRDLYREIGLYDLSLTIAMDYDFTLRCYLKKKKFKLINLELVNFLEGGKSDDPLKVFMESYRIRRRYLFLAIPLYESIQLGLRTFGMLIKNFGADGLRIRLKKIILSK